MYLILCLLSICLARVQINKLPKLPKVIPIKPKKIIEGKDSIEIIKARIIEFLDKHGKLNPTNPFRSPINEEFVTEEFNRIAKEGQNGVILDLYIAIVICLKFYMISHYIYRLDLAYVRKMQKIACYVLEHESDIATRYTSSAELHSNIAELCAPQKIRNPQASEKIPLVILPDQVQPKLQIKAASDEAKIILPTDELQYIAEQPFISNYKDIGSKDKYEIEKLHLQPKEELELIQET